REGAVAAQGEASDRAGLAAQVAVDLLEARGPGRRERLLGARVPLDGGVRGGGVDRELREGGALQECGRDEEGGAIHRVTVAPMICRRRRAFGRFRARPGVPTAANGERAGSRSGTTGRSACATLRRLRQATSRKQSGTALPRRHGCARSRRFVRSGGTP